MSEATRQNWRGRWQLLGSHWSTVPTTPLNQNQDHLTPALPADLQTEGQSWSCLNISAKMPQLAQSTESL